MTENIKNEVTYEVKFNGLRCSAKIHLSHDGKTISSHSLGLFDDQKSANASAVAAYNVFVDFADYLNNNNFTWDHVLITQEIINVRQLAAALHWQSAYDDMPESSWDNVFGSGNGEFLVLDSDESEEKCRESAKNYMDEFVLDAIPENLQQYFDEEQFIDNYLSNSDAGSVLSSYDGNEIELCVEDYFYLQRSEENYTSKYSDELKEFFIYQYSLPDDFDFDSAIWAWILDNFTDSDYDDEISADWLIYRQ